MKESYREGVANRPGPEPCECKPQDCARSVGQGIRRLGIELRNQRLQEPTASGCKEEATQRVARKRECGAARSRDPKHAEKLHAREPGDPVAARGSGGPGEEAMSHESSYERAAGSRSDRIVPTRSANKGRGMFRRSRWRVRRSAKETPSTGCDQCQRTPVH